MTTIALVHGAFHGAWCWDHLRPELEDRGFAVVAPDLPCDDPSAGCVAYADTVVTALADVHDEVIIVGHSLGGLTIPLVGRSAGWCSSAPSFPNPGVRSPLSTARRRACSPTHPQKPGR